eukprot:maker-scaffold_41-snap-gene-0.31-mRNA-1 protein AED:0.02 eAED:0.02 QI:19/1/1/1/1/1/2/271/133
MQIAPQVGDTVYGRITKVISRMAQIEFILQTVIDSKLDPDAEKYQGIIRKENVRKYEIDRVEMNNCFRVDDVVVGKIMTLGNPTQYEVTTAEESLGVVFALSNETKKPLSPVNSEEMVCEESNLIEKRKVAKI